MLSIQGIHLTSDAHRFPTKTPAKATRNRGENVYRGPMTVHNAKGKSNIIRTPFHPKTAQPERILKGVPGSISNKGPIHLITKPNKPLTDKTPFANRVLNDYNTPAPPPKFLKFNSLIPPANGTLEGTPASASGSARASSTRKHSRAPKSNVNFQTPVTKGNHWDVSDCDIVVPEVDQVETVEEELNDSDEIEYMPPNTLDLPYLPPFDFDLPDYKLFGKVALHSVYSYPNDELPPPTFDFQFSGHELMNWDTLSLPSLVADDEKPPKHPRSRPTTKVSATTSKPNATTSRVTSTSSATCRATLRLTANAPAPEHRTNSLVPATTKPLPTQLPSTTTAVARRQKPAVPASKTRPDVSGTRTHRINTVVPSARDTRLGHTTSSSSTSIRTTIRPQSALNHPTNVTMAKSVSRHVLSKPGVPLTRPHAISSARSGSSTKPDTASAVSRGLAKKPGVSKISETGTTITAQSKGALVSSTKKLISIKSAGVLPPMVSKPKPKPGASITAIKDGATNATKTRNLQGRIPNPEERQAKAAKAEVTMGQSSPVDIVAAQKVLTDNGALSAEGTMIGDGRRTLVSVDVPGLSKVVEDLGALAIVVEKTCAAEIVIKGDEGLETC